MSDHLRTRDNTMDNDGTAIVTTFSIFYSQVTLVLVLVMDLVIQGYILLSLPSSSSLSLWLSLLLVPYCSSDIEDIRRHQACHIKWNYIMRNLKKKIYDTGQVFELTPK